MSRTSLLFLIALASSSTLAAEKPDATDLSRLQGAWVTNAGPGKKIPVTLEFQNDRATVVLATPQGLKVKAEGRVKIDQAARPRRLDWVEFTVLDGQEMPEILAIYELDGETFRVCNGGPNSSRPTEFKPGEGALADVLVFRRKAAK